VVNRANSVFEKLPVDGWKLSDTGAKRENFLEARGSVEEDLSALWKMARTARLKRG
jgi:hypothetical protein